MSGLICTPNTGHPSIGGIFMRYSYEYKKKCIELYRQGKWPKTPEEIKTKDFRTKIREWVRLEESCGTEALQHKKQNRVWSAEEKYKLVAKVLAGASYTETAVATGISKGCRFVKHIGQRTRQEKASGEASWVSC